MLSKNDDQTVCRVGRVGLLAYNWPHDGASLFWRKRLQSSGYHFNSIPASGMLLPG